VPQLPFDRPIGVAAKALRVGGRQLLQVRERNTEDVGHRPIAAALPLAHARGSLHDARNMEGGKARAALLDQQQRREVNQHEQAHRGDDEPPEHRIKRILHRPGCRE
jgi:hypothetical protein